MVYKRIRMTDFVDSNEIKEGNNVDYGGHIFTNNGIYRNASSGMINGMSNGAAHDAEKTWSHSNLVLREWNVVSELLRHEQSQPRGSNDLPPGKPVLLDGKSITSGIVTVVSRFGKKISIDKTNENIQKIEDSVKMLADELNRGGSVYGVTTGFGGSADTRTGATTSLQLALLQMQLSGVLPVVIHTKQQHSSREQSYLLDPHTFTGLTMPPDWVRGTILVRCNSLLRGHSAVRLSVIETLCKLLDADILPLIPLRGSISASGDLSPLSYIAGAMEGNPDVLVWSGQGHGRRLISANEALSIAGITPIVLGPKEGLGLINGTAVSTAVAALALSEANQLVVLAQVLTAMTVEALMGMHDSFHPFIAQVRPHEGQTEVARNIRQFLKGSRLAQNGHGEDDDGLRQDRYPTRTSSQWLGPQLEDLVLAQKQIDIELNSTTDNPLIDVGSRKFHHGGNFQAVSITSSTEKTRSALQMTGKMVFAQSSELLNVEMNNGLPPNLAADDPSLSYTSKGLDINMAAYMSELAFLANPVSSHVQCAEMGNQAINSMALVSARYTHLALECVALMLSTHIFNLCQALDLRAMNTNFLATLNPLLLRISTEIFGPMFECTQLLQLHRQATKRLLSALAATTKQDANDRFKTVAEASMPVWVAAEPAENSTGVDLLASVRRWTRRVTEDSRALFEANRAAYMAAPDATPYLGAASARIYAFVRTELGVPFHRGLVDHPTFPETHGATDRKKTTIGSGVSLIYESLRSRKLTKVVMECLEEAQLEEVGGIEVQN